MRIRALAGLAALALAAAGAEAQVQRAPADPSQPPPRAGTDAVRLGELYYRLQVLQQEVQELRGLLEEQAYQMERLTRQQQEHYMDLDRRLTALRGAGEDAPLGGDPAGAQWVGELARSERQAYADAYDLMGEKRYQESVTAFDQLIRDYPNGQFTPNAFYWLGELYAVLEEIEKSRQSLAQVVNLYPEHAKVPDALYKLGVVHDRLGDQERALEYLNRVIKDYPESSAAGMADKYAKALAGAN